MSTRRPSSSPIWFAVIDLQIAGMTCASCATRIERRLNKLDGVDATVNYATEAARVSAPDRVTHGDLVAQVEAAGYRRGRARPRARHARRTAAHQPAGGPRATTSSSTRRTCAAG